MADCPECGKPGEARFAPFCSVRCQQVDLGRWLKGDYVIPGSRSESEGAPDPAQVPETDEE